MVGAAGLPTLARQPLPFPVSLSASLCRVSRATRVRFPLSLSGCISLSTSLALSFSLVSFSRPLCPPRPFSLCISACFPLSLLLPPFLPVLCPSFWDLLTELLCWNSNWCLTQTCGAALSAFREGRETPKANTLCPSLETSSTLPASSLHPSCRCASGDIVFSSGSSLMPCY